jgi:hypothetical protein
MSIARKWVAVFVVSLCGLLFAPLFAPLFAQAPQWQNLYPSYTGLAYGEGKFVAVSSDGVIKMSEDGGAGWSQYFASAGSVRSLYAAAYGAGRFVVTQNVPTPPTPPTLLYSTDGGRSWVNDLANNNACRFLVFGKESFVGIGEGSRTFVYGIDESAETWIWTLYPNTNIGSLRHAASDGNEFVAVGSNIMWSLNGNGWADAYNNQTISGGGLSLVAYGNEKYVAISSIGGAVYTSGNGRSGWTSTASNVPAGMTDLIFGGGKFVAVGAAGAGASSADGVTWTTSSLFNKDDFVAVRYGNGNFMALGANGSVYTSSDGVSWRGMASGRAMSYKQIVYGGSKFVAVGDSGVSISGDGKNWTRGESEGALKGLQGIAYGNGKFVAVGDSGALFTSQDGNQWTDASAADRGIMFMGVAYGESTSFSGFVAVGRGSAGGASIFTLADNAQNWTEESTISTYWPTQVYPISINFGNGKFLVGGSGSGMLKSTENGKFWSDVNVDGISGNRITSITYTNNRLIALGTSAAGSNAIFASLDGGNNWSAITAPQNTIKSVIFAKNYYVAVGDSGKILASPNGQEWVLQGQATNKNLQTIYFAENKFLAGGASGALLYSEADPTMVVSVRYAGRSGRAVQPALRMNMENKGRSLMINLSFTPDKPGTIAVYSLTGKQLYKTRVTAGERAVNLPNGRIASNGSVVVRYTDNEGKSVVQRFQMVR